MSDSDEVQDQSLPQLTIPAQPQISVYLTEGSGVCINTAGISEDFRNVEHQAVYIPLELVKEVANMMLEIHNNITK